MHAVFVIMERMSNLFIEKSFFVESAQDIDVVADLLLSGCMLLVKNGGAYGLFINPHIEGLADRVDILKNRENNQFYSLACSHEYILGIVDHERVNPDFYILAKLLQGKAILRIPLNTKNLISFPYNAENSSVQCFTFLPEQAHNNVFLRELERLGCPFTLLTSANLHGDPTCCTFEHAEKLSTALNERAKKCGLTRESYIRSILENRIPRDMPPPDYHAMMQAFFDTANDMRTIAAIAMSSGNVAAHAFDEAYVKIAYAILAVQEAVTLPIKGS